MSQSITEYALLELPERKIQSGAFGGGPFTSAESAEQSKAWLEDNKERMRIEAEAEQHLADELQKLSQLPATNEKRHYYERMKDNHWVIVSREVTPWKESNGMIEWT